MFYFTVAYHDIHEFANRVGDGLIYHDIDVSSPTLADDTLYWQTQSTDYNV